MSYPVLRLSSLVQLDGPTKLSLPGRSRPVEFGVMETFTYPFASGDGGVDVSTTRLETMLADAAVAVHPADPRHSGRIGKVTAYRSSSWSVAQRCVVAWSRALCVCVCVCVCVWDVELCNAV